MSLTIWVHGNVVQAEDPNFSIINRLGYHAEVDNNYGGNLFTPSLTAPAWLHFPIPTPVMQDNRQLRLKRVILDFFSEVNISVLQSVEVHDGARSVALFENLNLSQVHDFLPFDIPGTPAVQRGVCVSVKYLISAQNQPRKFAFHGVGADFI